MGTYAKVWMALKKSALSNGSSHRWRKIRERILRRDQRTCQRCGQEGDTVDHIIPRKLGGSDSDFNLQCLCRTCNFSKGGRLFDSAKPPMTLLGSFIPKNGEISHYQDE